MGQEYFSQATNPELDGPVIDNSFWEKIPTDSVSIYFSGWEFSHLINQPVISAIEVQNNLDSLKSLKNQRTRIVNLEPTQNLNNSTTVPTMIDWTSSVPVSPAIPNDFNFIVTDSEIETVQADTYEVYFYLEAINTSTSARRSILCGIYLNDVRQTEFDLYIRGTSADNIGAGHTSVELELIDGDIVECGCLRDASTGAINTNGIGSATVRIKKSKF